MAAPSLSTALLLLLSAASFGPASADPCKCQPPIITGGVSVVPGKITCEKLQKIPRSFFTSLEKRLDCKKNLESPVELWFEFDTVTDDRVVLSPSSFDPPQKKMMLQRVDFKQVCLTSIAPKFFSDFFDSSRLTTLAFQDVRCLTGIRKNSFAGLGKLNTFRWVRGNVQKIESGAFVGMDALEEFTFKDTRLRDLPAQLFEGTTSLSDLILSGNQIEAIPATFFQFKAKKVRLDLSQNKIKQLPAGTFDQFQLETLDLTGNSLTSFSVAVLGKENQKNVATVKLSDNRLTDLSQKLVAGRNIEKFSLYVDGNPWNCACDLQWFKSHFGEGEVNIDCASPPAFKGRKVNSLSNTDFCPKNQVNQISMAPRGGGGGGSKESYVAVTEKPPLKGASVGGGGGPSSQELIAIGTSVAVIAVMLICFFLIYRFRGRICKSKEKTQKQEYQAANMDEGYDGEPPVRTYVVA